MTDFFTTIGCQVIMNNKIFGVIGTVWTKGFLMFADVGNVLFLLYHT